jgi:tetratricopeptide (TPR) repeat protein
MLCETYVFLGDAARSEDTLKRTLEVAERTHNQGWIAYVLAHLSGVLAQLGRWPEARQHAERAVDSARQEAPTPMSALPLLRMGDLCIFEGAWEDADRVLEEAMAVADALDDPQFRESARCSLAELAFMQGHPEQALAQLQLALTTRHPNAYLGVPLPLLASIYLETGAIDEAEDVIRRGTEQATATHLPLALVPWLRLQAVLLGTKRKWDKAEHAFTEAVALPRSLPYPHAEAQAQYEWGRMELQRGRPQHARDLLEQALAIFQRLGATPAIERAEQVLAELPRPIEPSRP